MKPLLRRATRAIAILVSGLTIAHSGSAIAAVVNKSVTIDLATAITGGSSINLVVNDPLTLSAGDTLNLHFDFAGGKSIRFNGAGFENLYGWVQGVGGPCLTFTTTGTVTFSNAVGTVPASGPITETNSCVHFGLALFNFLSPGQFLQFSAVDFSMHVDAFSLAGPQNFRGPWIVWGAQSLQMVDTVLSSAVPAPSAGALLAFGAMIGWTRRLQAKIKARATAVSKSSLAIGPRVVASLAAAFALAVASVATSPAFATPVTFYFAGHMTQSGADVALGDSFAGSYTLESSVVPVPGTDATIEWQYPLAVTGWSVTYPTFTLSGSGGLIAVGNDRGIWGDRYIVTLGGPNTLPSGAPLNFFQIDLQDQAAAGEDLLSDSSIQTSPPNPALAGYSGGRLFTLGSLGCQCSLTITAFGLAPVSEPPPIGAPAPGAFALVGLGLIGIGAMRRPTRLIGGL